MTLCLSWNYINSGNRYKQSLEEIKPAQKQESMGEEGWLILTKKYVVLKCQVFYLHLGASRDHDLEKSMIKTL